MTIHTKAIETCSPLVLFIMHYNTLVTFESVGETINSDHSNESDVQYFQLTLFIRLSKAVSSLTVNRIFLRDQLLGTCLLLFSIFYKMQNSISSKPNNLSFLSLLDKWNYDTDGAHGKLKQFLRFSIFPNVQ